MVQKIDKKQHAVIAQRIANGETLQTVADDLGVSRERVRQIARDADVHPRRMSIDARNALIAGKAEQIVVDREWWIPARFVERGFTRKQFVVWLEENRTDLLDRWSRAEELPVSTSGSANPDGRLCLICNKRKPWSAFYRDHININGHSQKCSVCSRAEVERYRKLRNNPEPTVTEKQCSKCGKLKGADQFSRMTSATSGLQSQCKDCQRGYDSGE